MKNWKNPEIAELNVCETAGMDTSECPGFEKDPSVDMNSDIDTLCLFGKWWFCKYCCFRNCCPINNKGSQN